MLLYTETNKSVLEFLLFSIKTYFANASNENYRGAFRYYVTYTYLHVHWVSNLLPPLKSREPGVKLLADGAAANDAAD